MSRVVDRPRLNDICKMGKGAECCKYLLVDPDEGIICAKHDKYFGPYLKDKRGMVAEGDNCEGLR